MATDTPISIREYLVEGMTCGHCAASVTEEVGEVAGVEQVDVDLDSRRVTVTGSGYDDAAIAAAVEEAGYRLVDG
jgi:copper chaperone CopZ